MIKVCSGRGVEVWASRSDFFARDLSTAAAEARGNAKEKADFGVLEYIRAFNCEIHLAAKKDYYSFRHIVRVPNWETADEKKVPNSTKGSLR